MTRKLAHHRLILVSSCFDVGPSDLAHAAGISRDRAERLFIVRGLLEPTEAESVIWYGLVYRRAVELAEEYGIAPVAVCDPQCPVCSDRV